ncbi:MAG: ferredoxin [Desulfamplus sp.]|nr:ferredoxin [Desulfamplus sp.]MBF0413689.1 ferredoxin [Desulfamplus sp.]
MRKPVIDISECVLCDICVEMCPDIFIKNQAGYIEIADNVPDTVYQSLEDDINDVIKTCRGDCISWGEET